MKYEKDGFSWMDSETLADLMQPDRVKFIKKDHFQRTQTKAAKTKSWQDQIMDAEGDGCASCFI